MVRLEDLKSGSRVTGIRGDEPVTLEMIHPMGTEAVRITFRGSDGIIDEQLLFRFDEPDLSILSNSMPWNFQADGSRFRLVSEVVRIRLAYLFDPYLVVHTSSVESLPHQISAVYGKDYFDEDSQFEERTEYAGINSRSAYQIGVSLGEMLSCDYTGFRGTISEIQFIQC